ncbi:U3 small nucleolar RNA-associated protein 15 family protein [Acanthamoeba castellanii str. Neff]|uniref:U3 small nucleolar RNA-associated protein 15 family protein n=1 Tax=Acanthamoeba castellanii (strain ATCC 30010 / Neff) TaxID=1257118 RepID=L8GQV1_ACACF|nr:U3 small nucleolar RNA-associated protein 15 family protein [Acanthamoeba castellanii str. Neff]ELR15292.1 U3 small nucleolar RNA-associated protein 15 family protein [Acanthamoeba castellanii str. Neff]
MTQEYRVLPQKHFPRDPTNVSTGEQRHWKQFKFPVLIKQYGAVTSINFSPVSPHNFAVTSSSRVQIYSSASHKPVKTLSRFRDVAYSASYRNDGKLLVAGGEVPVVQIFDLGSRAILRSLRGHESPVHVTKWSLDNVHIFSSSDDKTVRYWDLPTEKEIQIMKGHQDYVRCGSTVASSPALWISGGYDHRVILWDTRSGQAVIKINHGHPLEAVLPFPSSTLLFTAGSDNEIRVWDILAGGRMIRSVSNHQKAITTLAFNADGSRLISGSLDQHLKIYDVVDYSVVHTIKYNAPILCSALSPDNTHLVTGLSDGMLSIRHRPQKPSERTQALAKKDSLQGGSHRAFLRAKRFAHNDHVVYKVSKKKMVRADHFMRAFRYKDALDDVLKMNTKKIYPLLEELAHRKALGRALAGRNDDALSPILIYVLANITKPQYSPLLIKIAHIILNIYSDVAGQSAMISDLLRKLLLKVRKEINFQEQSLRLLGTLDMLINSAVAAAALPAPLSA